MKDSTNKTKGVVVQMNNSVGNFEKMTDGQLQAMRDSIIHESMNRMEKVVTLLQEKQEKSDTSFKIYKDEQEEKSLQQEEKIDEVRDNYTLSSKEQVLLQKAINRRGYELAESPRYYDHFKDCDGQSFKDVARKIFPKIHYAVKSSFLCPSYKDVRKIDFKSAVGFVQNFVPNMTYRN